MVAETIANLRRAGSRSRVRIVVADAGYWCKDNLEGSDVEALISPGIALVRIVLTLSILLALSWRLALAMSEFTTVSAGDAGDRVPSCF